MAEGKKSFLLYVDIYHTVKKLSDEQAGKLFKHILSYVNDENPEIEDLILQVAFEPIKQQLKRDLKHWESICKVRSESGKMGGRPTKKAKKANALFEKQKKQTKAKKADNDNDNVNDTDNDNVKEEKKKYADYVSMTEKQYTELCTKYSEHNTKILIEILNNYKGSSGKKYKEDYLAILNWVVDKAKQDGKFRTL